MKSRGAVLVHETIGEEHHEMQSRVYARVRPYLAGAMRRLRRTHPSFQTVVFEAERGGFALIFGDGRRPNEAPSAFGGLAAACAELAALNQIEWLTATDPLWQVLQGTPQPEQVIDQYRHVEDLDWKFWMNRALTDARFYMRKAIYSRTVYGSHRPGYGVRITDMNGVAIDEWVDPIEPMILRVLRESGKAVPLKAMCDTLDNLSGFTGGYYCWDVLAVCGRLKKRGVLRRDNPRSSEFDARFSLRVCS